MNLAVCHRCPRRQRDCAGPCACTVDGEDIARHAEEGYCPEGRYRLGLGDAVARVLTTTSIAPVYRTLRAKVTSKPCGCKGRQQALNRIAGPSA